MTAHAQIIITVSEGTIHYLEYSNKWAAFREGALVAELNSLDAAKKFLTELVHREENPVSPFKRHEAFLCDYGCSDPKAVIVTSYASDTEAWVKTEEGRRSKQRLSCLRAGTPKNAEKVAEMNSLYDQERILGKKRQEIGETLSAYKKQD